jgi:methionyl aminopeptidase
MKFVKSFKFINLSKFNFSKTKKSFLIYTEPLLYDEYPITPSRIVPNEIVKPSYADFPAEKQEFYQNAGHSEVSIIKNPEDLKNFKQACKIAAGALMRACMNVKEGTTTEDIDKIIHDYIISQNAYPSAINYMGFPKSVCTSVNEVACHGIPNARKLKKGDYVNIDVTAYYNGFHGDTSAMVIVEDTHEDIKELIAVTRQAMYNAIAICKPGEKISNIGKVIEEYVKSHGFTVCSEYCGHGVGKYMHMQPMVSHAKNKSNFIMEPGMAFTIEPIVMMYPYKELTMWEDNWSVVCPYNPSAQWEHIIYITEKGYEILTFRENEDMPLI